MIDLLFEKLFDLIEEKGERFRLNINKKSASIWIIDFLIYIFFILYVFAIYYTYIIHILI